MRGLLAGLVLLPLAVIAVLSIRPGGLRRQLRNVRRRFKIFLVLAGIYLAVSIAGRVVLGDTPALTYVELAAVAVLGVIFVLLAQDPAEA